MFNFKRHKFMRTFLSVLLAITFLLQPLVTYASICEELAKVVNKISDAVGKVNDIKNEKFDEIEKKAEERLKEVQGDYDKAKSSYESSKSKLDAARTALNNANESDKEKLQQEYDSCLLINQSDKILYDNASKDLSNTKTACETVKNICKAAKGQNDSAQESASSASDASSNISGSDVGSNTKTGNMESLNSSATNMQSGQETLRKAGENLSKATDCLENTSNFIGNILDTIEPVTDLLEFIPTIGEIVEIVVTAATLAKDVLKVASDATNILSETFLSMAEQGKTSDADFIATLAAKTVSNAPDLLCDVGSTVLDVLENVVDVDIDGFMKNAGNKAQDIAKKFIDGDLVDNVVDFMNFDLIGDAAKKFANNLSVGHPKIAETITKHIKKDKKATDFIETGAKSLFGGVFDACENIYKEISGNDLPPVSIDKKLSKQGTSFLKKEGKNLADDAANSLGNMMQGE